MKYLVLSFALIIVASCTVGPNYEPRVDNDVASYGGEYKRAGKQATSAPANDWWLSLNDATLTNLITTAFTNSPNIQSGAARISRANEYVVEQRAGRLPTVSGSGIAAQTYLPGGTPFSGGASGGRTDSGFYNLGLSTSWEIDLFGGRRRLIEAATAEAEVYEADLADVYVSLAAQITTSYSELRSLQAREKVVAEVRELTDEQIALEEQRLRLGTSSVSRVAELRQRRNAEAVESLEIGNAKTVVSDRIALLAGLVPGSFDQMFADPSDIPLPPAEVDVGAPADLLRRRPDIRAAERKVAAANAKIGVAKANRFPTVSFFGLFGLGGPSIKDVTDTDSFAAILLPRINWTFLDFGRTKSKVSQSEAAHIEAEKNYDEVILKALHETERALSEFASYRERYYVEVSTQQEARNIEALVKERRGKGIESRISEIEIIRKRLRSDEQVARAASDLTSAFIRVEKSLGLGWSVDPRPDT